MPFSEKKSSTQDAEEGTYELADIVDTKKNLYATTRVVA